MKENQRNQLRNRLRRSMNKKRLVGNMKPGLLVMVVKNLQMEVNSALIASLAIISVSARNAIVKTRIISISLIDRKFPSKTNHQRIARSSLKKPICSVILAGNAFQNNPNQYIFVPLAHQISLKVILSISVLSARKLVISMITSLPSSRQYQARLPKKNWRIKTRQIWMRMKRNNILRDCLTSTTILTLRI